MEWITSKKAGDATASSSRIKTSQALGHALVK